MEICREREEMSETVGIFNQVGESIDKVRKS